MELADRLGYDYAWEVEHHFLEEYSHSPAPESFSAPPASAPRTSGSATASSSSPPTRRSASPNASRYSTCLQRPRRDGHRRNRVDHRTRRLRPRHGDQARGLRKRVRCIIPMFQDRGVEHHEMAQDAHAQRAAEAGAEAASAAVGRVLATRDHRDGRSARAGRARLPVPSAPMPRMRGCTPTTTASSSSRRSWRTIRPIRTSRWSATSCAPRPMKRHAPGGWRHVLPVRTALLRFELRRKRPDPYTVNMWDEYNKWKRENPDAAGSALSGGLIGSPETLRRKLRRFKTSNIDQVILLNQAGKNAHQHICESLELFAKEVMPEFHADEPAHQAWKARVLSVRSSWRRSTPRRSRTVTASSRSRLPAAARGLTLSPAIRILDQSLGNIARHPGQLLSYPTKDFCFGSKSSLARVSATSGSPLINGP